MISTDMVRHVMRCLQDTSPLLWASSYNGAETYAKLHPEDHKSDLVLQSYEAQCDIMLPWLQKLVANCIRLHESAILEGVHLSPQMITKIMTHVSSQNMHGILFPVIVCTSDEVLRSFCFCLQF